MLAGRSTVWGLTRSFVTPPLTFQKTDAGLRDPLHQAPHEELRAKELRRDKGSILQKPYFVGGEFHPLCRGGGRVKEEQAEVWDYSPNPQTQPSPFLTDFWVDSP